MPSEKQIMAAQQVLSRYYHFLTSDAVRAALTAAEQAEQAPAARSGAVKVRRPERVQAAFEVFKGREDTGPNATALFEYIEQLEAALEPSEPAPAEEPLASGVYGEFTPITVSSSTHTPSLSEARLREALERLLNHYVELVISGDAGFWDPEKERVVIEARAALKEDSDD